MIQPKAVNHPPTSRLKFWQIASLVILFGAALGIRIYDLSDPPFDFHPTRQFFTALVARGEYYQHLTEAPQWMRDQAVAQWKAEETDFPTIDALAVLTYRVIGHEDIFYPRLYSALFWVIGGAAIFLLARDLTSSVSGAILAAGFYLLAPYGIIASRSFQPDPLMVCLILFSWWGMYRWLITGKWAPAILAGVLAGMAMLTKVLAAFSLLGGMAGVFFACNLQKSIRQVRFWVMGILAAIPMISWMIYGFFIKRTLGSLFSLRFFPNLWIDPIYYLRLEFMAERVAGLIPLVLALLGFFLFSGREKRAFLAGLWGGYILFALVFGYYFETHDYYHITLIPIVALSLAPLGELLARGLAGLNPGRLARTAIIVVLLIGMGFNLLNVRQTLHKSDYSDRAAMLTHIGELLDHDSSVVALTEDYAYPLSYYAWIWASYWPQTGDVALRQLAGMSAPDFAQQFEKMTAGKRFFLVTDFEELERQPQLEQLLDSHYLVYDQGDGYTIFDLQSPKTNR